MRKLLISSSSIFMLMLAATSIQAQYLQDILKVSQPQQGSTARFKGLANAQNSLGGDLSSLSGNPAGLGFFNQSDFSFSFDFFSNQNSAQYFGTTSDYTQNKFGLNQAGIVMHIPSTRDRGANLQHGWLNFNIGVGYHKTNHFNHRLGYSGQNSSSTFAHFLADQRDAGNTVEGNFGWDSYLLDFSEFNPQNTYHYPSVLEGNNVQKNILTEGGHQTETNISFGSNYSNKLYIGFSVGIPTFAYTNSQLFTEGGLTKSYYDIHQENPNSEFLDPGTEAGQLLEREYDLEYNYRQTTSGTGINAKFGLIYKPVPNVNVGISASTPTWYTVSDDASTYMDTWYYENASATTPFHSYASDEIQDYLEYVLRSPYRINGGVSAIFGNGLISADVEFVDYASMRFSASDQLGATAKADVDGNMNDGISGNYTGAVNFRIGGEYLFTPQFLARAGFGHQGSPYKDLDITTQLVSAGIGYRVNRMYIDLAYQNTSQSYVSQPYTIDTNFWTEAANPEASVENRHHAAFLTVGFKF